MVKRNLCEHAGIKAILTFMAFMILKPDKVILTILVYAEY
jgi:hypothetical protein